MADVVPLKLSSKHAQELINGLAKESSNVVFLSHVRKRQRQRNITNKQILGCLRNGYPIEHDPFVNNKGNWQITMCHRTAGEELVVVVAIDWPSQILVITAY